jgi:ParB family transcriptional regulator, chromosome partitioning protein
MGEEMISDKRKALGRGLESLLPSRTPPVAAQTGVQEVPIDLIEANPYQTRRRLKEETLNELAESIRASGVVQPVILRPSPNGRFQLVAGERRWRASRVAGKTAVPAVIRQLSEEQAMEITIIENLQREDLNPMEQARAFERLSREFGLTQEQISTRTGKDRATIANFIRLLRLPEVVQQALETGVLSFGHGKVLAGLANFPEQLDKAARETIARDLSVRQTEDLVGRVLTPGNGSKPAKPEPAQDPNVLEAQRNLERALGIKAEIHDRKGKGKIVLHYGSLEDFDRIMEALDTQG